MNTDGIEALGTPENVAGSDFIEVYDNVLSADLCARLRDMFKQDGLAQAGVTGQGVDTKKKISRDIMLNQHPQLASLLEEVTEATRKQLVKYFAKYHFMLIAPLGLKIRGNDGTPVDLTNENYEQYGKGKEEQFMRALYRLGNIQAQHYAKAVGNYNYWHCEVYPQKGGVEALHRSLLFMFYLNDVAEGGETDFYYQNKRVKPREGRMVVAPAYFTHTHRGRTPQSSDKYILTSWVLLNQAQQLFR